MVTLAWGVDQAIAGIVINMASIGVVRFLSSITFANEPGGSISQSPPLENLPTVSLPLARVVLEPVGEAGVPFVSAWARLLTGLLTDVSVATVLGLPCVTTLTGAAAAVSAIRAVREEALDVRPLQDYHSRSTQTQQ